MANWYGTARSNYFKVKDPEAFKAWVEKRGLQLLHGSDEKGFGIAVGDSSDSGGWPTTDSEAITAGKTDEECEISIHDELAEHLAEGEIAILMEAGAEKLRYVTGNAVAIHSSGKRIEIDLFEIYSKAAKKFKVDVRSISMAQY